jgi:hypothetical protein
MFPLISVAVDIVVLVSFWAEHATRGVRLSWPLVQSPSVNIYARVPTASPRLRIIVSGHYDTQRTAFLLRVGKYVIPVF